MTKSNLSEENAELRWALINIMDGIKDHDIQGQTGLSEKECMKIARIRDQAIRATKGVNSEG